MYCRRKNSKRHGAIKVGYVSDAVVQGLILHLPNLGIGVKLNLQVALHPCRYLWLIKVFLRSSAASQEDAYR